MEKIRVMLADDSKEYMEILKEELEKDGRICVIAMAEDGEEGLDTAERENPDFY